jgi:hypothetical protein
MLSFMKIFAFLVGPKNSRRLLLPRITKEYTTYYSGDNHSWKFAEEANDPFVRLMVTTLS